MMISGTKTSQKHQVSTLQTSEKVLSQAMSIDLAREVMKTHSTIQMSTTHLSTMPLEAMEVEVCSSQSKR